MGGQLSVMIGRGLRPVQKQRGRRPEAEKPTGQSFFQAAWPWVMVFTITGLVYACVIYLRDGLTVEEAAKHAVAWLVVAIIIGAANGFQALRAGRRYGTSVTTRRTLKR